MQYCTPAGEQDAIRTACSDLPSLPDRRDPLLHVWFVVGLPYAVGPAQMGGNLMSY